MILVEGLYVDGSLCSRRSQDDPGGGLYNIHGSLCSRWSQDDPGGRVIDGSLCSRRSQDDPDRGLYMVLYVLDGHKMILVEGIPTVFSWDNIQQYNGKFFFRSN